MNGSQTKRGFFAVLWTVIAVLQADRLLASQPLEGDRRVKAIILLVLALALAVGYTVSWWNGRNREVQLVKDEHVS